MYSPHFSSEYGIIRCWKKAFPISSRSCHRNTRSRWSSSRSSDDNGTTGSILHTRLGDEPNQTTNEIQSNSRYLHIGRSFLLFD